MYLTSEGKLLEGTITDMSLYGDVSATYGTYFAENPPAREMVCVKELPLGARVEISMIATKS